MTSTNESIKEIKEILTNIKKKLDEIEGAHTAPNIINPINMKDTYVSDLEPLPGSKKK